MREIKFRAWSNGNYHFDGFVVYPDGKTEWPESGWDLHGVDDKILIEQYTGLRDANGVEIYEGDIVRWWWKWQDCWGPYAVVSMGCCWVGDEEVPALWMTNDCPLNNECFVIGNIHENPELLK